MSQTDFQLLGFSDPRLAIHAAGALPAWLWSADGSRVLWANPIGARIFGASNGVALAARTFGPTDAHRRQIAQLAPRLPENGAVRLERLRGFGAPLGTMATCGYARIDLADGSHGILVTTADAGVRTMPLVERLQRLVDDSAATLAAFTADGLIAGASASGRKSFGLQDLSDDHLAEACATALADGHAQAQLALGRVMLYRVGSGADVGLIALLMPAGARAGETASAALSDDAMPVQSNPVSTEMPADRPPADVAHGETEAQDRITDDEAPQPAIEAAAPCDAPSIVEHRNESGAEPAPPYAESAAVGEAKAGQTPSLVDEPHVTRRHPLRFMWQMNADGRFSLVSDAFIHLMGGRSAAHLGRPWPELRDALGLDPHGHVSAALDSRETWSAVMVPWPVDGGGSL
ncbi:MAG: PAS domain-containing sensor histidine kinase, partial [Devosia sp.]